MPDLNAKNLFDLRGKVAVVTGGGGGLCGSMCRALGQLGVKVAVTDLALDKAEAVAEAVRKEGGAAEAFACSVLDVPSMQTACSSIRDTLGAPDLLINGAGGNARGAVRASSSSRRGPWPVRTSRDSSTSSRRASCAHSS